jgi:hypothetical protein
VKRPSWLLFFCSAVVLIGSSLAAYQGNEKTPLTLQISGVLLVLRSRCLRSTCLLLLVGLTALLDLFVLLLLGVAQQGFNLAVAVLTDGA